MFKSPIRTGYPSMLMSRKSAAVEENVFIFTVVTAGADTFQLPLEVAGTYDFTVVWGDGDSDSITAWNDVAANHSYASAGTWTVRITGTIAGWRFNNAGDKALIYNIQSWGPLKLENGNGCFYGCSNLTITATDTLDTSAVVDMASAFRACTSLTTVPSMDSWDTSSVTTMSSIFRSATNFNQDIGSWDTSSVTDMSTMFLLSSFNQDIGLWDTSSVTNMSNMFSSTPFNQDIGSWDVGSVTNISSMFYSNLAFNQDISSWDVSSVTTMYDMFRSAASFNQDISGWTTTSLTILTATFRSAAAFDQDLSSWDIDAVTDATNFLLGVTISTANYDALLIGWEGQVEQPNVTFHGGSSKYSAGAAATARAALVANGWAITDGGQV